MPRKKHDAVNEITENGTPTDQANPDAEVPFDAAGLEDPAAGQAKKTWTPRPDPFDSKLVKWADGYKVQLLESDSNREIFVQFGNGSKADQPQAFEAIKKTFKDAGMYWDPKVQGWAKGLKLGQTPLIREENRRVRAAVEDSFYQAVALEEDKRGPSLSEHTRQQSGHER